MKLIFSYLPLRPYILGDLEVFDLSDNTLTGQIPSELDNLLAASIYLSGNANM